MGNSQFFVAATHRQVGSRQSGISLIEVIVALFITLIGLLGLTGLIARSNQAEMESYQRVQALMLLQDMVDRINVNRKVAACYSNDATGRTVGTSFMGTFTGLTCTASGPIPGPATSQQNAQVVADLTAWSNMLQGSAEVSSGSKIGAMIGARGCITQIDAANSIYIVSVAWQGLVASGVGGNLCGQNLYGNENLRRVVTATVRIGDLTS